MNMTPKVRVARDAAVHTDFSDGVGIIEYLSGADGTPISLVTARISGCHPQRRNPRSVKVYFVLSGEITAWVSGQRHHLLVGDVLVVRAGEAHELEGEANAVVICAPPYDAADETLLEATGETGPSDARVGA